MTRGRRIRPRGNWREYSTSRLRSRRIDRMILHRCMPCRDIKAKCLLAEPTSAPQDPCKRCVRLGLHCVYTPKRRPTRYTKVGANSERAGTEGHGDSSNPDSPAGSQPPPLMTSGSGLAPPASGHSMETHGSYGMPIDPHLTTKYAQQQRPAVQPASAVLWGTYSAPSGYNIAGEYDTSATRSSIQPITAPQLHRPVTMPPRRGDDQPPITGFSRRPTEYGMSTTGSESDPSPGLAASMLPPNRVTSPSMTSNGIGGGGFSDSRSTPAQAATGMDIVSDLSRMRSSGNGSAGRVDETYRLSLPSLGYPTASAETSNARPSYERFYSGASFDTSASRDQDRNGRIQASDSIASANAGAPYKPSSISMIVHSPSDVAAQLGTDPDARQDVQRSLKRRRNASPPSSNRGIDKGKSSAAFASEAGVAGVVIPGKYDAVRYDREDAEENGRGVDWLSLVLRKRVGFEGTECPDSLGIITEDEVRFLFDQ